MSKYFFLGRKKLGSCDGGARPFRGPAAVFVIVILIAFLRMPERLFNGYLWAEDANIFIKASYENGWHSLIEPYSGYLHLLPRTIAYLQARFGALPYTPWIFPVVCLVLCAVACAYIYCVADCYLKLMSAEHRPVLAAVIALTPFLVPQSGEVYLNITNVQWVVCPALVALMWDSFNLSDFADMSRAGLAARATGLFVLTLTGPFGVLLSPVAIVAAIAKLRQRCALHVAVLLGVYALSVTIQGTVMVMYYASRHSLQRLDWLHDFTAHQMLDLFVPPPIGARLGSYSIEIGILIAVVMLTCIITSRARAAGLILLTFALELWLIGESRNNDVDHPLSWQGWGARYLFLPAVFFTWVLVMGAATAPRASLRAASTCLCVALLFTSATQFKVQKFEEWKLQWDGTTDTFRLSVPPPGWAVTLPVYDQRVSNPPVTGLADCSIDAINRKSATVEPIDIEGPLFVQGWAAVSAEKGIAADEVFVALLGHDGTILSTTRARMMPRPDVNAYFKQPEMGVVGFEAVLDTNDFKGDFRLQIYVRRQNQFFACPTSVQLHH